MHSCHWKSPPRVRRERGKSVLTLFFWLLGHFNQEVFPLSRGSNHYYCRQVLQRLKDRISERCLSQVWLIQHGNGPAYTEFSVQKILVAKNMTLDATILTLLVWLLGSYSSFLERNFRYGSVVLSMSWNSDTAADRPTHGACGICSRPPLHSLGWDFFVMDNNHQYKLCVYFAVEMIL